MNNKYYFLLLCFILLLHGEFAEPKDNHDITACTLDWREGPPPKDISNSKAFKKWVKESFIEDLHSTRYAAVSLFTPESQELIVQERVGGTGGYGFIILSKATNQWKSLTYEQGAFIISDAPSKKHKLTIYVRSGRNHYRISGRFNGDRYKLSSQRLDEDLLFDGGVPFDDYFWDLIDACDQSHKAQIPMDPEVSRRR
jgi:hypothetical protein